MQVLSCAPARVRDSFSHYEGESPRGLDTELYGETNEKDSWGPRSLWAIRRFLVNPREVGNWEATCQLVLNRRYTRKPARVDAHSRDAALMNHMDG
jgi:hypothetical protein